MDSSDWLKGSVEEAESSGCRLTAVSCFSSPSATDMLAACTRLPAAAFAAAALMDGGRRLRPPEDQGLKCPRCASTSTKFCYYNNYSLSQPRYFCKTCRRYWTKGGTLRNIPVGGSCRRKIKKPTSSCSASQKPTTININNNDPTNHRSYQNYEDAPAIFSSGVQDHSSSFWESNLGGSANIFPQNPRPIGFLDSKFDFAGVNNDLGMVNPEINREHMRDNNNNGLELYPPQYGLLSLEANNGEAPMDTETCQRQIQTYYHHGSVDQSPYAVMPNTIMLSPVWRQDQGCSDSKKHGAAYGGYTNGPGSMA